MSNNTFRAQFLYENLMIQNNIIHHSYLHGVKKLLFLGSSCIYPKNCPQPIKEEYLLTDVLEYTNEPYAIAKIAGIKMCEAYNIQYGTDFISVMPTNLYGPNDNYNLGTSHVLPAMIRKMHLGKCLENRDWESLRKDLKRYPIEGLNDKSSESEIIEKLRKFGIHLSINHTPPGNFQQVTITLWGTGTPYREFLFVDDLAEACVFVMNNVDFIDLRDLHPEPSAINPVQFVSSPQNASDIKNTHINIGSGNDITIKDLALLIKKTVGFKGRLRWDDSRPDGTFRKLLDVSRINMYGWRYRIDLETGVNMIYNQYSS
jgi:GDP-L-fucose synthase